MAWKQGNVVAAVWSRCRGSVVAWTALQTTVCETKSYKYSLPTNKVPNFIIKKLLTQNLAPVEGFLIKTKKLWLFYSKFRHIPNPDQWHCKFSNRLDIASKKILFFRNPWFQCKLQVSGVQQPPAILEDISNFQFCRHVVTDQPIFYNFRSSRITECSTDLGCPESPGFLRKL